MPTAKVQAPPKVKADAVEIRLSIIEKVIKGDRETHSNHVHVEISDPKLAAAIVKLIEDATDLDIAGAEDAAKLEYPERDHKLNAKG